MRAAVRKFRRMGEDARMGERGLFVDVRSALNRRRALGRILRCGSCFHSAGVKKSANDKQRVRVTGGGCSDAALEQKDNEFQQLLHALLSGYSVPR